MKVISSLQGTVALHVSGDEVTPERGLPVRDLLTYLKETYQFSTAPQFPPNFPQALMQNLVFQSGVFIATDASKLPIYQLGMVQNGDMVTAQSTEVADVVLDDLVKRLDADLGYRYSTATKKERFYQSYLVVQFDELDKRIEGIRKIEGILSREIKLPGFSPSFKRLGFGQGDVTQEITFELIGKSDFLIERRSGSDYSQNRYACSAPLPTAEHIRVLEVLERELGN